MSPFIDSLVLTPPPYHSSHAQSPPHAAGPASDLQSQLRPFQGLDLQHQLQQLNISQCSGGDTSPAVVAPPLQTQLHHGCSVVVSNAVTNGNQCMVRATWKHQVSVSGGVSLVCEDAHLCGVSVLGCTSRCVLVVECVSEHHSVCVGECLITRL